MTDLTELRRLAEAAERIEVQPEWTEADWDDHEAYIAALDPTTVLRLLDVVEAAEAWHEWRERTGQLSQTAHEHHILAALARLKGADDD